VSRLAFDGGALSFKFRDSARGAPGNGTAVAGWVHRTPNNKAAGFVSYGSAGGVRAVENLRLISSELQIAPVRAQVAFSLATVTEDVAA
jgi:NAD(P)H-dependent FMN reductase